MQIKFLGTGGAFDYELGNSAAFLHFKGRGILIDCGHTVFGKLRELQLVDQIDDILITHLHDDHVGSLTTFILFHAYYLPTSKKLNILVPNKFFRDHLYQFIKFAIPNPEECMTFSYLSEFDGISAVDTFGLHVPEMPSFGYIFESKQSILAYSGDLGNSQIMFDSIPKDTNKAVRIFHDMAFEESDGLHVHYHDLEQQIGDYEVFAYHLNHLQEPEDNSIPLVANFPEFLF
ncbi:MBL fold metallo-hydrolase [Pontibacter sp. G13]|uniref:MBL fold metallo-hydrolase n=1 Tax=Pontibacter sp. G13 TaxID=3074898 RepID=UPI002889E3E7|nr:MBL fold metallo-hydrolase [Pontibacter sp. G13]WNJ15924.1 MBL fold metallo-hydrolase [Pontibacter sp. G13]